MAYDNTVTVVGNVTRDPELRYTSGNGVAVTNFSVAWNRKDKDDNDIANFFDVTCWRQLAENVAESVNKGDRVVVFGRLDHQTWEKNGESRSKVEIVADEVAISLRWVTVSETEKNLPKAGWSKATRADFPKNEEPF